MQSPRLSTVQCISCGHSMSTLRVNILQHLSHNSWLQYTRRHKSSHQRTPSARKLFLTSQDTWRCLVNRWPSKNQHLTRKTSQMDYHNVALVTRATELLSAGLHFRLSFQCMQVLAARAHHNACTSEMLLSAQRSTITHSYMPSGTKSLLSSNCKWQSNKMFLLVRKYMQAADYADPFPTGPV